MESFVLPILLIVANVLGAGMIVPQLTRLRRLRVISGISGTWVGVGIAMNLWWLTYGLQGRLWGLVPVSAGAGILYALIAFGMLSIAGRKTLRPLGIGFFGLGLVPLPFLVAGGWELAGIAIGFCYGLQFMPAAISAVRSPRIDGVSPETWVMAWVEAVIWLVYGVTVNDAALVVGGGGGAFMATIILVRVLGEWRGDRRGADVVTAAQAPVELVVPTQPPSPSPTGRATQIR